MICSLTAAVQYHIQVSAGTSKGFGLPASLDVWTEPGLPDVPLRPYVVATGNTNITIQIQPSVLSQGPVSGYFIAVQQIQPEPDIPFVGRRRRSLPDPVTFIPLPGGYTASFLDPVNVTRMRYFTVGDGINYNGYINAPLKVLQFYTIYYIIASSLDGVTKMAFSQIPNPVQVGSVPVTMTTSPSQQLTPALTTIAAYMSTSVLSGPSGLTEGEKAAIGVFVGLFILVLAIITILLYFCWWRKRSQHERNNNNGAIWAQYLKDFSNTLNSTSQFGNPRKWNHIRSVEEPRYVVSEDDGPDDIDVANLQRPLSFPDEYRKLPTGETFAQSCSRQPENDAKNRFPHLHAYDHSRVVLQLGGGNTGYINANYIASYDGRRKGYIAAQSPFNKGTICDFWLMISQEQVKQIVFMGHLVEDNIVKCEQYWPDDELTHEYGNIEVTLRRTHFFSNFIIRKLTVKKLTEPAPRKITQYQFTSWPDHGVPDDPIPLLEFRLKVKRMTTDQCPMVIHCGTGVSRTAFFIALDFSLERARVENRVNVYKCCSAMRHCRPMMVRTLKQYIFLYDALFEALVTNHCIVQSDVNVTYRLLQARNASTGESYFQEQFKVLEKYTELPSDESCLECRAPENISKNRFSTLRLLARDSDRPTLANLARGAPRYINALLLDSYTRRNAFIVTQTPLASTVEDFWALIYEHEACCLVAVNGMDYMEETCINYWPQQENIVERTPNGEFLITLLSTHTTEHVTRRQLRLTNERQPSARPHLITQYQFQTWKMYDPVPWSRDGFLDLLDQVNAVKEIQHPIIVHCADGASQSGLFCASYIVCEKMKLDRQVDVFHSVKHLKRKRFHFINSLVSY